MDYNPNPQVKMCAWNRKEMILDPNPLVYGEGFVWTASFNCVQLCDNPKWIYYWKIFAWDPDAKDGEGDWTCIFNDDRTADGELGNHGGSQTLPDEEAAGWWNDKVNPSDYDVTKGLKFTCKVKCTTCKAQMMVGGIIPVTTS